jgi:hypothetical protein
MILPISNQHLKTISVNFVHLCVGSKQEKLTDLQNCIPCNCSKLTFIIRNLLVYDEMYGVTQAYGPLQDSIFLFQNSSQDYKISAFKY